MPALSSILPIRWRLAFTAVLGLMLLTGGAARAQASLSVSASASPMTVGTEETVTYTVRIEGAAFSTITTPDPPNTTGLAVQRATPTSRRQVSLVNGEMQRVALYEWQFKPVRDGTARFRPMEITVRGATFTTAPIDIEVVPQAQRAGAAGATGPSRESGDAEPVLSSRDLFIRAEPETQTAYQNEQVILEYHLYFRDGVRLRNSRLAEAWNATGFWREELEVESRPLPRSVRIDGIAYQTIVLKRVALFPTRTGTLRIDPLKIETEARARHPLHQRSPFLVPGRYESVALTSDSLAIEVLPLPPGAPASFGGAVGDFDVTTQLRTSDASVGSSVELQATFSGTGNIATLEAPSWTGPSEVEVYPPDVETSVDRTGNRARGTKTFSYTLVPQASGAHTIPPIEFVYFDPQAERYRTLRSEAHRLHVSEGSARPAASSTTGAGLPVDDIAGLMTHRPHWRAVAESPLHRTPWAYGAVLAPLLLALGLLAARRRRSADAVPPAATTPTAHVERAQHLLSADDPTAFYTALREAVLGLLSTRLSLKAHALTHDQLDRHLEQYDLPDHARRALFELLNVCDRACFSPAQPTMKARKSALQRTRQLVDYFQTHLPHNGPPA